MVEAVPGLRALNWALANVLVTATDGEEVIVIRGTNGRSGDSTRLGETAARRARISGMTQNQPGEFQAPEITPTEMMNQSPQT